jgi:hypothetical protein
MTNEPAGGLRDQASRRVRRLTAVGIAGATALTAAFSGLAAGSTHVGKAVTKRIAPTAKTVTAPVPSLTPSADGDPAPQPQAPQPTPVAPATQPPVAVTGGS